MRKLKFDLTAKSDALLCPNPSEFYAKSYITESVASNFRTLPGVKETTKVASIMFDNLLNEAGCAWSPTDSVLDAEPVAVCSLDAMVQVCQKDLEATFVSNKMAKGDSNWNESEFFSHYWETLQAAVSSEIQLIRWNGDTDLSGGTLSQCDGYLVQLEDTEAVKVSGTTAITKTNIIDVLEKVVGALPEAVKGDKANVRIYMSETNAFYYQLATLGLNANFNYTGELALAFAGYQISVEPGMNDKFIVAANKNQMAYAFDGEGDSSDLKIVNMMDTAAEPVIRTRVGLKLGFKILDEGTGVTYYQAN